MTDAALAAKGFKVIEILENLDDVKRFLAISASTIQLKFNRLRRCHNNTIFDCYAVEAWP
jgi:hypothetical protein